MKNAIYLILVVVLTACFSANPTMQSKKDSEQQVVISNDSLEYQIIIIDPGFTAYLHSIAKPKSYYSNSYYKVKNMFYVNEWNMRVRSPMRYRQSVFEQIIDYSPNTDYGLEVNYKLFNYFKFVEYKYKVNFNLSGLR